MNKKYLLIIGAVLLVLLIFEFPKDDTPEIASLDNKPAESDLTPTDTITHGHGLAVDVSDPSKVYIATHHGLLLLQNEKDLYRIGKSRDDYMGFSPHPTESNVFFS